MSSHSNGGGSDYGLTPKAMRAYLAAKHAVVDHPAVINVKDSLTALLRGHKRLKPDEVVSFELLTGEQQQQ